MKRFKYYLVSVLLGSGLLANAQNGLHTSGGNASGTGGNISFSLGQLVYTQHSGTSGSIALGVQHPFEIFSVGISEVKTSLSVSLFPNPTTESIMLQTDGIREGQLHYRLTDLQGKLLQESVLAREQTSISMMDLPPAAYFLRVLNSENKSIQTFKIIKK